MVRCSHHWQICLTSESNFQSSNILSVYVAGECPDTHPYAIPMIEFVIDYDVVYFIFLLLLKLVDRELCTHVICVQDSSTEGWYLASDRYESWCEDGQSIVVCLGVRMVSQ